MEEKTVQLSVKTMIRECSKNPNLTMEHLSYFIFKNRENVHDVFRYKKFNDDFVDTVTCYRKDDELVGIIRPSYDEYLNKLLQTLGISTKGQIIDNDLLTKRMLDQVEALKTINNETELAYYYPLLHKDLVDGRRYYESLQKMKKQEQITDEEYADGEHYYYGCAMKKSLKNFIETQSVLYQRLILKRFEYKDKVENTSFNSYIRKYFDVNKLMMYVIHRYLCTCEEGNNKEVIRKYVSLVEKYLNGPYDKTVSLEDNGVKINYDMIVQRYSNLKKVLGDNSNLVEWILIPEGKNYSRVKSDKAPQMTVMSMEEVKRLESLGERKRTFYESSPYLAKVMGLRRYHGYVGYIYPNGEVILDREYIAHHPSTASGDAIYHMNVHDFEELSRCDKQELMKNPKVGRKNHTSTWEERVSKLINLPATKESEKDSIQLIKRLKEKRTY